MVDYGGVIVMVRGLRVTRTASRQGERQAMFKVQLALVVLQHASRVRAEEKWESMVRKMMARVAAVPGWAKRWMYAEKVLAELALQEELRYIARVQDAECSHNGTQWVMQRHKMADVRNARLLVRRRVDEAREIVGEQQGLVQDEARKMAADAQMEEARLLLAAGAGQGIGAKVETTGDTDYEMAALAEQREEALQSLLEVEQRLIEKEGRRAAEWEQWKARAEARAVRELGKRQRLQQEQSARRAEWLEEAGGLEAIAMVRKAERRADKQERRCVQLMRGLEWVEQKLAELMAEREGVWRELRQSKKQLKKAEARVQYERSQAQHIWQTARQCGAGLRGAGARTRDGTAVAGTKAAVVPIEARADKTVGSGRG